MGKAIQAIDLCGGAGGWACAARGLPVEIVLAVDLWEDACKTYELNFPGTTVYRADLRNPDVHAGILEACPTPTDLVLGGIPCEWVSRLRNGNRPGVDELAGQRRTLDAVLDMVKAIAPRWWCLEDVCDIFKELPPFTPHMVLWSAEDSPQNRRRLFIGEFPAPPRGSCSALADSCFRPGPYRLGRRLATRECVEGHAARGKAKAIHGGKKALTIINQSSQHEGEYGVLAPELPGGKRQLEWQEAARLQGFPEDFLFYGSATSVGKMVGQAIQIDTGRAILEAIVQEKEKNLHPRGGKKSRSIAAASAGNLKKKTLLAGKEN